MEEANVNHVKYFSIRRRKKSTMAINMIMASSRALVTPSSSSITPPPATPAKLPHISLPKLCLSKFQSAQKSLLPSISLAIASSLTMVPPSLAEEMEKASLFDFNLTLPIIAGEFLFLMVALDKIYYTPLGNFMDARDAEIREKLNSVKDTSTEVKQLEDQAAAIMRAARAEIASSLNKMKKETQVEVEEKLAEGRKKIEIELQEALVNLEKQKDDTIKALDSQIAALSEDIVKKVLPIS
ncbi:ATP synthase [Lithospermum erythrorhizon]|uniref:ATP synthase n=1 Tax=Lithospermum erythrorhizon TaxID=34254 RepID=A0AAV3PUB2_LITER